jgi:hypothetical protein
MLGSCCYSKLRFKELGAIGLLVQAPAQAAVKRQMVPTVSTVWSGAEA